MYMHVYNVQVHFIYPELNGCSTVSPPPLPLPSLAAGVDFAGQSAEVVSAGVTVDTSPPSLGRLWLEGAGGAESVILSARWEPPLDLESGVVELEWALGSTPGSSDILEWNLTDAVSGVEVDGSEFSDGQVLFLSIKVSVLLSWKPQCFYVLHPLTLSQGIF